MIAGRLTLAAVSLAAALALAGESARTSLASGQESVYSLRGDPRLCASPMCGGFWASRVNWRLTTCRDGTALAACYAASIDLSPLDAATRARARPALASGRALVEGAFARYSNRFPQLSKLVAGRVWLRAGSRSTAGVVYRVIDTGLRCIRAPCFSLRATLVNGTRSITLSDLDLAGAGVTPATIARAHATLAHGGVLVSGTTRALQSPGIAGPGRTFAATQLWLPA